MQKLRLWQNTLPLLLTKYECVVAHSHKKPLPFSFARLYLEYTMSLDCSSLNGLDDLYLSYTMFPGCSSLNVLDDLLYCTLYIVCFLFFF